MDVTILVKRFVSVVLLAGVAINFSAMTIPDESTSDLILERAADYERKLQELDHFCNDPFRKPGKVQADIRKAVRFLGENSLKYRDYVTSAQEIWIHFQTVPSSVGFDSADNTWIKTLINGAREAITEFYEKPRSAGARYRIRIPYYTEFINRVMGKPYRLDFVTPPKPAEVSLQMAPHDPTIGFWQRMVHSIDDTSRVFLIYDTPDVVSSDETINTPDAWSGSGEVAAACSIGQCIPHLRPYIPIDIRRWCDMSFLELEIPNRCLIILGSSLRNRYMQRLRERERWKPRQKFHFESPEGSEKHGYICKGGVVGTAGEQDEKFGWEAGSLGSSTEYALVTFFRDVVNRQTLIALQGITTVGTLAATRYMCNTGRIAELTKAFEAQSIDIFKRLPSFELLLKVHVEKDSSLGDTTFCELEVHTDQPAAKNGFNAKGSTT